MRSRLAATAVILALLGSSFAFVAATQLGATAPSPTPAPTPVRSGLAITITTSRYGFVSAVTTVGATCSAQARLPSGRASTASGLRGSKTADAEGYVSWTYATSAQTTPGSGTHVVTCSYRSETRGVTATFTVP